MASLIGLDTTPVKLQLKLTNYAENLESELRYYVERISFSVTVILNDGRSVDDIVNYSELLSEEDQEVLKWQAREEDLQEPLEVRKDLIDLSGRLCPYKEIALSFVDFVTDENSKQQTTGNLPLSSYRRVSFRSAMLTKHSAPDGQPELLFLHDGLGENESSLRWRSHDYMKLRYEQKPSYKVFWLIQWDIVDFSSPIGSPNDTTNQGRRRRSASSLQDPILRPGADSESFHCVRSCEKRKSPWIAEVRQQGSRRKIWLGNYKTPEAAARAADAGIHYYNLTRLNFRDSPSFLKQIPRGVLSDKGKEEFVKSEAHRLAELTEMMPSQLPSTWYPENRFSRSQPRDTRNSSNYTAGNMPPATTANFAGLPISDGVAPLLDSESDPETDVDEQPSISYGSDLLQVIGGSSPEEDLWPSTPNGRFTANSQVRAGVLYAPHERADMCQHTLTPVGNCSSEDNTNIVFDNVFTSTLWGENLTLPDNLALPDIPGAIVGDIARESPTEIPSVEILGVSNNIFRLPLEMERQTTSLASHGNDSGHGAESVQIEPNDDWDYIDIYGHWLFQCNHEDVRHQSQPNLPGQWYQR